MDFRNHLSECEYIFFKTFKSPGEVCSYATLSDYKGICAVLVGCMHNMHTKQHIKVITKGIALYFMHNMHPKQQVKPYHYIIYVLIFWNHVKLVFGNTRLFQKMFIFLMHIWTWTIWPNIPLTYWNLSFSEIVFNSYWHSVMQYCIESDN